MAGNQETSGGRGLNRARLAAVALTTGGVLVALTTLGWALARYVQLSRTLDAPAAGFWQTTAVLFAGVAGALFLWGIAEVLRKLDLLIEVRREAGSAAAPETTLYGVPFRSEPSYRAPDELKATLAELLSLTRELRDVVLLSEPERAARVKVQGAALARQLEAEIPALLQEHKWVEARQRVQQARERFPAFPDWDRLAQQIESLRAGVEARDVENIARQVNDLAALGAWDRAMGVVAELLQRHPNSAAAQDLARRVSLQRDKADAEQRARLMAQAQEAVTQREWNRALSLANDVIRRFSQSAEAEALRQQLPVLIENAEIQTRHQMEAEYRELVKQHRYADALRLAREVITRYPNSPQATVMRDQLPRLEARAASA